MIDRVKRKLVEWWVYKDVDTGRWGYVNKWPGVKHAGLEGPMNFVQAKDRVYAKNKEVQP